MFQKNVIKKTWTTCCSVDENRIEQCFTAHFNCSQLRTILFSIVINNSGLTMSLTMKNVGGETLLNPAGSKCFAV